MLAAAKRDPLSLLKLHFDRGKLRSRMGAVAEFTGSVAGPRGH